MTTQAGADAIMAAFAEGRTQRQIRDTLHAKVVRATALLANRRYFCCSRDVGAQECCHNAEVLRRELRRGTRGSRSDVGGGRRYRGQRQATPVHRATDSDLIAELAKRGYNLAGINNE